MILSSWRQTRPFTCGPACLMVALHEYGGLGLSAEREMRIFQRVRHLVVLGSTPAYLAQYAVHADLSAILAYDPAVARRHSRVGRGLHGWIHAYLQKIYLATAMAAKWRGLDVTRMLRAGDIADILLSGQDRKAIYLIVDDEGIFHFILVRGRDGCLVVMDPADGANTSFDPHGFWARYGNALMGYCVLLSDR